MYPANAANFKIGKGGLYVAPWTDVSTAPDAYDIGYRLGNCEAVTLEPGDAQVLEKYSSTQYNSPLVDQRTLRQKWSVLAQLDEHTFRNLEMYAAGTLSQVSQGSATAQTYTFTNIKKGRTYQLGGATPVRSATLTNIKKGSVTLVSGTDYIWFASAGHVYIPEDSSLVDDDDIVATYDIPAKTINKIVGNASMDKYAKLVFASDDANTDGTTAKGILTAWKSKIAGEGAYALVSEQYGQFQMRFTMLEDSAHAGELFKIEYL